MALTLHEAYILELRQKIKQIRKDQGYKTDAGEVVSIWNDEKIPEEITSMINIYDDPASNSSLDSSYDTPQFNVYFFIVSRYGKDKDEMLHYLREALADVKYVLGKNRRYFEQRYKGKTFRIKECGIDDMVEAPELLGAAHVTLLADYYEAAFGIGPDFQYVLPAFFKTDIELIGDKDEMNCEYYLPEDIIEMTDEIIFNGAVLSRGAGYSIEARKIVVASAPNRDDILIANYIKA
jgi:hypothetical protein